MDDPKLLLQLLGTVIGAAVLYYVSRTDKRVDKIAERLGNVEQYIQSELRLMDVRIARIETHLWPDRQPERHK